MLLGCPRKCNASVMCFDILGIVAWFSRQLKSSNCIFNIKVGFLGRKYHGAFMQLNYKLGICLPWNFERNKKLDFGRKK
jgi:hypothetical protein